MILKCERFIKFIQISYLKGNLNCMYHWDFDLVVTFYLSYTESYFDCESVLHYCASKLHFPRGKMLSANRQSSLPSASESGREDICHCCQLVSSVPCLLC